MVEKISVEAFPCEIDLASVVRECYSDALSEVLGCLGSGRSVLVEIPRALAPIFIEGLEACAVLWGEPPLCLVSEGKSGDFPVDRVYAGLMEALDASARHRRPSVVVVPHFDLLVGGDASGRSMSHLARNVLLGMAMRSSVSVLAFKDPGVVFPEAVEGYFHARVEVGGLKTSDLKKLITRVEALRLGEESVDLGRLHKAVGGLDPASLRGLMEAISSSRFEGASFGEVWGFLGRHSRGSASAVPDLSLEDVAGYAALRARLERDVLSVWRSDTPQSGHLLLHGPAGVGKSMLAGALANEVDATCILVKAGELKGMWLGESESRVRALFKRAARQAPCVLVFDEIDAYPRRGDGSSGESGLLTQLLTEMEGVCASPAGVMVVATTNHAERLDEALRSRFAFQIGVPYPDRGDRRAILCHHASRASVSLPGEVLETLVEETEAVIDQQTFERFSGRSLRALVQGLAQARGRGEALTSALAASLVRSRLRTRQRGADFESLRGYGGVKARLEREVLTPLRLARDADPETRARLARLIPGGVILEGPPGTGKTLLARALGQSLGAPVRVIQGPEVKSKWFGESEGRLREIFAASRACPLSVLVFDEIDAIAGRREEGRLGVERSIVNQLLTEMDGFNERGLMLIVGTTNCVSLMDPALLRPGRFELVLEVGWPDVASRRAIFEHFNGAFELGLDLVQLEVLVEGTEGFVDAASEVRFAGAHIEAICRALARRRWLGASQVDVDALRAVIEAQRRTPEETLSDEEVAVVAAHEAGHAVVHLATPGLPPLEHLSIGVGAGRLGYTKSGVSRLQTETLLKGRLKALMGGRCAERMVFGEVSAGCAQDLKQATEIAFRIVACFGMDGAFGPVYAHQRGEAGSSSGWTAEVRGRVRALLCEAELEAAAILESHREVFEDLRHRLALHRRIDLMGVGLPAGEPGRRSL